MAAISDLKLRDLAVDLASPVLKDIVAELYPGKSDPIPLCEQELSFNIKGVSSAVSNAFQRVMTQELPGCYLSADINSMDKTTDPFMKPEFVITLRLNNVPLVHGSNLAALGELELALDVTNETDTVLEVHTGDLQIKKGRLSKPIFNPNITLAILQPGKRIVIDKIVPVESLGRIVSAASVAIRGRSIPQDLERIPRERTHVGLQGDACMSGYVLSSAVAVPREFMVAVNIKAAYRGSLEALRLPSKACRNITTRLRQTLEVINRSVAESGPKGMAGMAVPSTDVSSWTVDTTDGVITGKLSLRGETITILEMLRVEVNDVAPDMAFIGIDDGPEAGIIGLDLTRRTGDEHELHAILQRAIKNLIALFGTLLESAERR